MWYSQEARPYALVTLLSALSLLFFARTRARPEARNFAGWAVASALALATHYFALFVVLPEALWLLRDARSRRAAAVASAAVAVVMGALAPLALYQRVHGGPAWIATTAFGPRLKAIPYFLVTGRDNGAPPKMALLAIALGFGIAIASVLRARQSRLRRGALVALGVGLCAIAIPLAGKLAGSDYVLGRNLLPAWLPLTIAVTAGVGTLSRRLLTVGVVGVSLAALAVNVLVALSPQHQRDDWRGVAAALGPATPGRVIVITPWWQPGTLALYRPRLRVMPPAAATKEIDTVMYNGFVPFNSSTHLITPGSPFRRMQTITIQRFTIVRYVAPHSTTQLRTALTDRSANGAVPFVEPPEAAHSG